MFDISDMEALKDKLCKGCDAGVFDLTWYEKAHRMKTRLWLCLNFWGDVCGWCGRMKKIRYPLMTKAQYLKFLDEPVNKQENKLYVLCFISIRQGGRTQVSVEMLEQRLQILYQLKALSKPSDFYQYMSLSEFLDSHTEVDPRSIEFVQFVVDGVARVGVKCLRPASYEPLVSMPFNAIDTRIQTSHTTDLELLKMLQSRLDIVTVNTGSASASLVDEGVASEATASSQAQLSNRRGG